MLLDAVCAPPPVCTRVYIPLPSKFATPPRARPPCTRTPCSSGAGRRRSVLEDRVAGRQDHVGEAAAGQVGLPVEPDRLGRRPVRSSPSSALQVAQQPAELGLRTSGVNCIKQRACRAAIVAGVSRTPGDELAHERAGRRNAVAKLPKYAVAPSRSSARAGRPPRAGCPARAASAIIVRLKLVKKSLSCSSFWSSRPRSSEARRSACAGRAARFPGTPSGPARRSSGLRACPERVVQRLAPDSPATSGSCPTSSAPVGWCTSPVPKPVQQVLEILSSCPPEARSGSGRAGPGTRSA